jgi:hypothetical protein
MLVAAFAIAYWARETVPLFINVPDVQPSAVRYIPTALLHVIVIVVMLYLSRLYHLPRAISRIDHARKVVGVVTVGSLLVYGLQGILFPSGSLFAVPYPRGLLFYVWILSMTLVVLGREFQQGFRYWR